MSLIVEIFLIVVGHWLAGPNDPLVQDQSQMKRQKSCGESRSQFSSNFVPIVKLFVVRPEFNRGIATLLHDFYQIYC